MRIRIIPCLLALSVCCIIILKNGYGATSEQQQLPPIETFILNPIELENLCFWAPAGKIGPVINNGCGPKLGCISTCEVPALVNHIKTEACPPEVARLLAEYAACYHERNLPLTIFNGWQWEYPLSLNQYESVSYDLPARGGSWENSWEAIATHSSGSIGFRWIQVSKYSAVMQEQKNITQESKIDVITFDDMRTRDGYPKKRQF